MMMNNNNITTKQIGDFGENAATDFLMRNNFSIIKRNYRYGKCEIDIIAEDQNFIVFVEVKTRTAIDQNSNPYGRPARAVTKDKQRLLLKATYHFLHTHNINKQPRMDILEVYLNPMQSGMSVDHILQIRNAFGAR